MPDAVALPASPTLQPKAAELLAQASRTVLVARALADAGRTVDLAGLDTLVGVACAQTLDLPPHEGRALRPALAALLSDCDALCGALHLFSNRQKAESCQSRHPPP